jgi:hypothetical protein
LLLMFTLSTVFKSIPVRLVSWVSVIKTFDACETLAVNPSCCRAVR